MVIRSWGRRLADTLISNFRGAPDYMAWEMVTGRAYLLCLELRLHCQLLLPLSLICLVFESAVSIGLWLGRRPQQGAKCLPVSFGLETCSHDAARLAYQGESRPPAACCPSSTALSQTFLRLFINPWKRLSVGKPHGASPSIKEDQSPRVLFIRPIHSSRRPCLETSTAVTMSGEAAPVLLSHP